MSKLRNAAKGQACVRCGRYDETVVLAHYSGRGAHEFGKCMGRKCHDLAAAWLCYPCHTHMDSYADGNTLEREAEFLRLCLKTAVALHKQGVIV